MKDLYLKIRNTDNGEPPIVYRIDEAKLKEAIVDPIAFGIDFIDDLETNEFSFVRLDKAEQRQAAIDGLVYAECFSEAVAALIVDGKHEEAEALQEREELEN